MWEREGEGGGGEVGEVTDTWREEGITVWEREEGITVWEREEEGGGGEVGEVTDTWREEGIKVWEGGWGGYGRLEGKQGGVGRSPRTAVSASGWGLGCVRRDPYSKEGCVRGDPCSKEGWWVGVRDAGTLGVCERSVRGGAPYRCPSRPWGWVGWGARRGDAGGT